LTVPSLKNNKFYFGYVLQSDIHTLSPSQGSGMPAKAVWCMLAAKTLCLFPH